MSDIQLDTGLTDVEQIEIILVTLLCLFIVYVIYSLYEAGSNRTDNRLRETIARNKLTQDDLKHYKRTGIYKL